MGVMNCPHCEEDVSKLIRTGERKYSCGQCSMVIAYDDIQPHLDEFNVVDKRGDDEDDSSNTSEGDEEQQSIDQPMTQESSSTNEREKIYQRGTAGLKEIKKGRLKNWLNNTDGVGAQTEQRILMVFDRNESVHKNPHVLYNLLDDELNASASYINTMVQDIFAPEEEHSDLLQSQGYTPWYNRGAPQGGGQQQGSFGGPMNATGQTGFNPNQQSQQQGQQGQQSQDSGNDPLSRGEAEMMVRQAVNQANENNQRGALMDGLSDATDEAVREMASNVGGLAGTVHRVIDEALVQYARENPEWVIENMGILQKVLGAAEGMEGGGAAQKEQKPEQNAKVDDALESLSGQQNQSEETQQSQPQPEQQRQQSSPQQQKEQEPNPDLDERHMEDSRFNPDMEESSPMSASPEPEPEADRQPEQHERQQLESVSEDDESEHSNDESPDEGFDDIFGDMKTE